MAIPDRKRVRVITNRVDFITTAGAIRNGIGMSTDINNAMFKMLNDLEVLNANRSIRGLVQTANGFSIQLSIL